MAFDLNDEEREVLRRLSQTKRPILCPRCARREVPSRSSTGWCGTCSDEDLYRKELAKARQQRWLDKRKKE